MVTTLYTRRTPTHLFRVTCDEDNQVRIRITKGGRMVKDLRIPLTDWDEHKDALIKRMK